MGFEWTELTYQQILAGNTAVCVSRSACSWPSSCWSPSTRAGASPLVVILIVPMCPALALAGVQLTGGDNNVFTADRADRAGGAGV